MVLVILGLKASVAWAGPVTTQLAIIIDGSGSISVLDFRDVKDGFANALRSQAPIDGTVEITVIQFAGNITDTVSPDDLTGARVEVPPTVISSQSVLDSVATAIQNITKKNGTTPMAAGINLAVTKITGSPNFSTATKQFINLASDGAPNIPLNQGESAALAAASAALAAGIDELDAEGTGDAISFPSFQNFLCDLVFTSVAPSGCTFISPPFSAGSFPVRNSQGIGNQGFVLLVANLDNFAAAVDQKLDILIVSPPVADAGPIPDGNKNDGPYGCFVNQQITLDGSGSFDPDNQAATDKGITTFAWALQSGSGTFSNANVKQPQFTCPGTTGTVTVQLTVTKAGGLTDTDTAQIVVTTQPNAPVADAGPTPDGNKSDGPYTCKTGATIPLNGTGSFDPDNPGAANKGITVFAWEIQSGGGSFGSTSIAQPSFTCPGTAGSVTVKLTVTKTGGLTDNDTATINVVQPAGPVANAGADTICRAGNTVQLDGTASFDPDNDVPPNRGIGVFAWTIQSGGGSLAGANTVAPTLTCPASGTVVVKLTVTDSDDNLTDDDTVNVTVTPNVPPVADAGGPYTCAIGQANIQLNGTDSFDPDNQNAANKGIVTYAWDLDNDGQFDDSTSATPTTTCPPESGTKTVKLRVTDSDGATDEDITTIVTPRLCAKSGKVDDLIKDLLLKGHPFKDLFVNLRTELFDLTNELEEILDLIELNPSSADIRDALSQLIAIGSVADFFEAFIEEIDSARLEYLCEIDVMKTLLTAEVSTKKYGKTTGSRILKQLDLMKKLLDQLAQAIAALQTKLQDIDDAIADAITALQDNDDEAAADALGRAYKLTNGATSDVDRMLRKQLSQLLRAQSTIEKTHKIELNNRKVGKGKKSLEPWVVIEQGTLSVQGSNVRELTIEVYALSGARVAQVQRTTDRVALDVLMGEDRAEGVYLYLVNVTDQAGRSWKSELKKLVWQKN
jgi:hypothetical protein